MWRALSPNLPETTTASLACTLDSAELIPYSIDRDCKFSDRAAQRSVAKIQEDVQQITADLVSIKLAFNPNLLSGLGYRDLHKLMKSFIVKWGSVY